MVFLLGWAAVLSGGAGLINTYARTVKGGFIWTLLEVQFQFE